MMARAALVAGCAFMLSACGQFPGGGNNEPRRTSADEPPGQSAIAIPPGMADRPLLPGQSGGEYTPDGMPALQPARGVSVDTLFAEDIRDPVERIKRVENAVLELRRDFNAVMPAIVRLSAVEDDMQQLLVQLESLLGTEPPPADDVSYAPVTAPPVPGQDAGTAAASGTPPPETAPSAPPAVTATAAPQPVTPPATTIPEPPDAAPPAPAPAMPPEAPVPVPAAPEAAPEAASGPASEPAPALAGPSGRPAVQEMRIGEHGDRTRLVFDVNGPVSYSYDLDNTENLLVIEMPGVAWNETRQQSFAQSPRIASYSVQAMDGGGSRIIIALKRAASVSYETTIKPNANSSNYRAVIDLAG